MQREIENDAIVLAGIGRLRMKVIDATLCVKGWRYECGFMKKDGTIDRRMQTRFYWIDQLIPNP